MNLPRFRRAARLPPAPPPVVTVYTRADCGCCRKALDVLSKARERHEFTIKVVDIDSDPELQNSYSTAVPVVEVGGKVRFRGVVNPVLLGRLLNAEGRRGGT